MGLSKSIDGSVGMSLLRKEIPHGSAALKPVAGKEVQGVFGEGGVSVLAVFRTADMDPSVFPVYVFIPEGTKLSDAKTGGIHDGTHGPLFYIRDGGNKLKGFFL